MKIQYLQISNALSFKYYDPSDAEWPKINFTPQKENGPDIHILIGPNGAGKSNLLEIISHIFDKVLFQLFERKLIDPNNEKDTIVKFSPQHPHLGMTIAPNIETSEKDQIIKIWLYLDDND